MYSPSDMGRIKVAQNKIPKDSAIVPWLWNVVVDNTRNNGIPRNRRSREDRE
jgi:hypothetical protein